MDKSFWDRFQELKESINGGVEPMDTVRLQTRMVKIGLGMYLSQSLVISLWWSIKDGAFYPWLFFISTFLQIGWFWNKVTDSWKYARGYRYVRVESQDTSAYDLETSTYETHYNPPPINIQNDGITGVNDSVGIDLGGREILDPLRNPELHSTDSSYDSL